MLIGLGVSLSGLKIGGTQDDLIMSAYEFYAVTANIQKLIVECNSDVGWHHFIEYKYWRNLVSALVFDELQVSGRGRERSDYLICVRQYNNLKQNLFYFDYSVLSKLLSHHKNI